MFAQISLSHGLLRFLCVSIKNVLPCVLYSVLSIATQNGPCRFFVLKYTVELQWLEHRWLVYHGYFELVLETLGKKSIAADIIIVGII